MTYALGQKSLTQLSGVHPDLARVVKRAIGLSTQDFTVFEGLRSQATQNAYLKRGVTTVKFSQHMKQADGYGHAVDLVPWVAGGPRWEWPIIYPIAAAMALAARQEGVSIRWGGCWTNLDDIVATPAAMKAAVNAYTDSRRKMGRTAFLDGPHYEMAN